MRTSNISSDIELDSKPIDPMDDLEDDEHKTKPQTKSQTTMERVNEAYSSQSSAELAQCVSEDFDLTFSDLFFSIGILGGPALWLFLQSCSRDTKKRILDVLSPFRSGFKATNLSEQTVGMTGGTPFLQSKPGIGVGAGIGIALGLFMVTYLTPEIKILEDRFQRRTKLNQLLTQHLEKGTLIPKGLSEIQLIEWLEDPSKSEFTGLTREPITLEHFQDVNLEEANRLMSLRVLFEIINAIYAVSVANTDMALMGISKAIPNHLGLAFNLIMGTALAYSYYQLAEHRVNGILLYTQQSYLAGKLAISRRQLADTQVSVVSDALASLNKKSSTDDFLMAVIQPPTPKELALTAECAHIETQLSECERQIDTHKKTNFNNLLLANAALKGFQEGGNAVIAVIGIPLMIVTHFVTVALPPLFVILLAVTIITVAVYCAYKSYEIKKEEIEKADAAAKSPSVPEAPVKIDPSQLTPAPQAQVKAPSKSVSTSSWCMRFLGSKPKSDNGKPGIKDIELQSYSKACAAA